MGSGKSRAQRGRDVCSGRVETANRQWGNIATGVRDPPVCIGRCQEQFFKRVVPGYEDENFTNVCEALSDNSPSGESSRLWELYCCDSVLCGVWINQTIGVLGQDPNVNSVINRCQNLGKAEIYDPGPPPERFFCPADSVSRGDDGLPCPRRDPGHPISTAQVATMTVITVDTRPQPTVQEPTSSSGVATSSKAVSIEGQGDESSRGNESEGLSAGAVAAIVVCSVLAVLILVVLVSCCFRRSRSRRSCLRNDKQQARHNLSPLRGSPALLISPTNSVTSEATTPISPPLRLRERRLLSTLLSPSGPASRRTLANPVRATVPAPTYRSSNQSPISPVSAYSTTCASRGAANTAPGCGHGTSTPAQATRSGKTDSLSSFGSNPATIASEFSTASLSLATGQASSQRTGPVTPPTSPLRPQRPHQSLLEIPNLVRPNPERRCGPGPPPKRALPPAPPVSPSSATSPSSSTAPYPLQDHGEVGLALGVVAHNPAHGVELHQESRDLCEHTERYGRESRDSWGSWGGTGGGGPGVAVSSYKNASGGAARANSPVLEEIDLERMGGRY